MYTSYTCGLRSYQWETLCLPCVTLLLGVVIDTVALRISIFSERPCVFTISCTARDIPRRSIYIYIYIYIYKYIYIYTYNRDFRLINLSPTKNSPRSTLVAYVRFIWADDNYVGARHSLKHRKIRTHVSENLSLDESPAPVIRTPPLDTGPPALV